MSGAELHLRESVFMAYSDGVLVILDLEHDRYRAMTRSASAMLKPWLEGRAGPPNEAAHLLAAADVLTDCAPGKPARLTEAAPIHEAITAARASLLDHTLAAWCRRLAAQHLKRQHLARTIAARRAWRSRTMATASLDGIVSGAARFARTGALAGGRDQCLREALALLMFLGRRGAAANWVFGVRATPFAAHCWVQWDDVVLNDTLESVAPYTPIMVV